MLLVPHSLGVGNCPSGEPDGMTVLLVDSTDSLGEAQRLDLRNQLLAEVANTPRGGAVQLWRVAAGGEVPAPASELTCNPGSEANPWIENEHRIARNYNDRFRKPLELQLEALIEGQSDRESPIMETVQAIALRTMTSTMRSRGQRRLIIASDLLQNTSLYSQVRTIEPFAAFKTSQAFQAVSGPLNGVSVELHYIRRRNPVQGREHIEFWQAFFASQGATLARVVPVAGLN
jgi:hypothetical protein